MIKKINKINNFGSFKNFLADDDLKDFVKYNLIFGYNGSGKTTLSRFFSCLALGNGLNEKFIKDDYKEDFEIISEQGSILSGFGQYQKDVKIFNVDFIEKELKFDENKLSTITVDFGSDRDKIKKRIERFTRIKNRFFIKDNSGLTSNKLTIEQEIETNVNNLNNLYTNLATEIRVMLHIDNAQSYNKTKFENAYKDYESTSEIITEELLKKNIEIHNQADQSEIQYIDETNKILTEDEYKEIILLLKTSIKRKGSTLKEDIIKWIEKGKEYDVKENGNKCYFCNNSILNWNERLAEINGIISKDTEYEEFEKRYQIAVKILKNKVEESSNTKFIKSPSRDISELDFLKINRKNAQTYISSIPLYRDLYQVNLLNKIHDALLAKGQNFENIEFDFDGFNYEVATNLKNDIGEFVKTVNKNNKEVQSIETNKTNAKNTVVNYFIQNNNKKISDILKFFDEAYKEEEKIKTFISKIDVKMQILNQLLENQTEAIGKIEQYIEAIFSTKKFHFDFIQSDKKYRILREGNREAKNLSEGEKTVIAFSYFLATLESSNSNLRESIIVIDDPISSLDQNYLFNLINLLCRRFKTENSFEQLFILTHNFYFFKKIKGILKHKANDRDIFNIFEITNSGNTSQIINAASPLIKFQSEYLAQIDYLKSILDQENDIPEVRNGVAIRKIFEIFLAYQCPLGQTLFIKFNKVFDEDTNKYRYLEDIANACCHTDELDDLDASETYRLAVGKNEIRQLFQFIQSVDKNHHVALNLPDFNENI